MELTTANNPEPVEQETELASEAPEPELEAVEPEGDEPEAEAEEEYEEIERGGKRYKIPKELAPELMMQADYTRKTQEAADLRKQALAERESFQREAAIQNELGEERALMARIKADLQELQEIDFTKLTIEQQSQYLYQRDQLHQAKADVERRADQKYGELQQRQQQHAQHVMQQALKELQSPDPKNGWSGKFDKATADDLTQFALDAGFTIEEVRGTNHPTMIKVLNLAKIGKAYLNQKKTAPAPRPQAEVSAKVPSARAPVTPSPAKMNHNQMIAHLKKTGVL